MKFLDCIWIIFTIMFFEWRSRSPFSWATIVVITAFAHQTSSIAMLCLVFIRLILDKNLKQAAKVAAAFLVTSLLGLLIILNFGTINDYKNSLIFSSGFGVAKTFLSFKNEKIVQENKI